MGNSSSGVSRTSEVDKLGRAEDAAVAGVSPSISSASCVSSMEKTVLLHDWWLIKVRDEGDRERLAVGGLTAFGKAARIFNSAPVAKRYDAYTLETTDGITVRIQGLINGFILHRKGEKPHLCLRVTLDGLLQHLNRRHIRARKMWISTLFSLAE
ncbi:unnamed protein product [Spirodela intermedia]|uniref:SANTA domain-containing protein n=2 Tax=Spirodela intermedia TaxID=51605 RepID=A0A7I8K6Z1_SPIIN|nr:unnamed protein product [Spirodela intermedia]CAA6656823.1 unnamed protein product [Spirodela intermedia]CAA7392769.1 unnamed protein product [Spirodela intermedia]